MSTEVAVIDAAEQQRLAEMMGAKKQQTGGVPQLKINLHHEDADDRPIPAGTVFLTDMDKTVYAKTARIRVLGHHYQYSEYDPEQKKTVNKTVINSTFQQEFLDQNGTTKCGMPKAKSKMDEGEKKRFENVTCFRQLRVLASYTGKTADGEEITVENQPAIMRLKGANFMPFEEEVMSKLPSGRDLWDFGVDLSLEKMKNGSVTYFVIHFTPDFANPLPLDNDTVETLKHFAAMIEGENRKVIEAHNQAIRQRTEAYDLGADLEADVA